MRSAQKSNGPAIVVEAAQAEPVLLVLVPLLTVRMRMKTPCQSMLAMLATLANTHDASPVTKWRRNSLMIPLKMEWRTQKQQQQQQRHQEFHEVAAKLKEARAIPWDCKELMKKMMLMMEEATTGLE
jgi:hypothetical protein